MSGQEKGFSATPFNDPAPTHEVLLQTLSCLNDGLFIADGLGIITYMNAAAEEITGLSSFQAVGRPFRDVFKAFSSGPDPSRPLHPEEEDSTRHQKWSFLRDDGKSIPLYCILTPLKDRAGKTIGRMGILRDVSRTKILEDDWQLSESQYRQFFEGSRNLWNSSRRFDTKIKKQGSRVQA